MSEKRQPWMKWYPADWRADPALRMCSLAARGLWIELLGFMHEAEPYGHLIVGGRCPTPAQIASLVGADLRSVNTALAELEAASVFSRDDEGRMISRRMLRDKAKADQDRQNGRSGGNPSLRTRGDVPDNRSEPQGVNPPDKAQKPDTRDTSSLRSDGAPAPPPPAEPARDVRAELFGAGLARARRITGKSDGQCRAMIGRWLRDLGDDCPGLSRVLFEAEDARPADPMAWIEAAVRARRGERPPPQASPVRRSNGLAEARRRRLEREGAGLFQGDDARPVAAEVVQ
jgi:hypothetical protein